MDTRLAKPSDYKQLRETFKTKFPFNTQSEFANYLLRELDTSASTEIYVVHNIVLGSLIGYFELRYGIAIGFKKYAQLNALLVDHNYRECGIIDYVMKYIFNTVKQKNYKHLLLLIEVDDLLQNSTITREYNTNIFNLGKIMCMEVV